MQIQEIDDEYEPNDDEIRDYAEYIGIDPQNEQQLLFLAKEGLKQPLPQDWIAIKNDDDEVYYQNMVTKESLWDHPCDDIYRQKVIDERSKSKKPILNSAPVPLKAQPAAQKGSSLLSQISQLQNNSKTPQANNPIQLQKPATVQQPEPHNSDNDFQKVQLNQRTSDDFSVQKKSNFLNDFDEQPKLVQRSNAKAPEPTSQMGFDYPDVELNSYSSVIQQPLQQNSTALETKTQQTANSQEILKLTQQHADQVRNLTSQQNQEIGQMNKLHFEKLQQIRVSNDSEISRIKQDHELNIQQLKTQLNAEYNKLQNQLRSKLEQEMQQSLVQSIRLNNLGMSTSFQPNTDVNGKNTEFNNKYQTLLANNQLLQQQIADQENVSLHKHKQLNELKNQIELYQQQITILNNQKAAYQEEHSQIKQEVDQYQQQLNQLYKNKQYNINQFSTSQQPILQQNQETALISQIQQLDCFTSFGTSVIYSLPDQLRHQFIAEKQLIQHLFNNLNMERQEIDLRIKALEAKRISFTAENRVVDLSDKNTKQNIILQRKALDSESQIVQRLAKQFRDAWDFLKRKKQFANSFLTTCIYSLLQHKQILAQISQFCANRNFQSEDLVINSLNLDQSSQFDSIFEELRFQIQQMLSGEEIRRLCLCKDSFLYKYNNECDFSKIKVLENNGFFIQQNEAVPLLIYQIIKKFSSESDQTINKFCEQNNNLMNNNWIDQLRKGLK